MAEQFRDISRDGYWRLRTADRQFQSLLTFRDLDFLATVVACDREYYDGKDSLEGPQPCRSTAALLPSAVSSQAVDQHCVNYTPAVVKVEDRIERRIFPGPPNYMSVEDGDRRDVQWILRLSKPVCVNGKGGDTPDSESEADVSELQLVISSSGEFRRYRPLLGRDVLVTGALFHAFTMHHRTSVLLTVRRIEAQASHRER